MWAVPSDQVKEIAANVNSNIILASFNDDIKDFLNNGCDYQVFIFNKNGHWVSCAVDYRTDKIYFVDSLKNFKKQKYSKLDRGIISSIRAGMSELQDFVVDTGGGGGGSAV